MENFVFNLDNYKEALEKLKLGEYTYKYIYEMKMNEEKDCIKDYTIVEGDNCFILLNQKTHKYSLFFYKPKEIKYSNIKKSQTEIFSTLQIDEFMKENSIQDLEFQVDFDKAGSYYYYNKHKNYIQYIKGDEFNFKAITITQENFELNYELLVSDKFSPLKLSKYFYDYFEFNNILDEKDFIYYNTPERVQLMKKLEDFYLSQLNYFKFCGPISGGKSTTLLKFKSKYIGIIYFNLKAIKKYYLDGNSMYKSIMLYEMGRININNKKIEDIKKQLNEIMEESLLENIFIKIIELLLTLNIRNILVIDQFKNTHFEILKLEEIQKKIYNTYVGLIISSSIDEKEIKRELEETLIKCNAMPEKITLQNQHYYFYVPDLLKNKIVKNEYISLNKISEDLIDLYEQFSFKTEYISMLGTVEKLDKGIEKINSQITGQMGKQCLLPESITIEFVLLLINDYIEKALEYKRENISILDMIPLKFIDIHFDDKNFSFHYGFPYIKTLVEKKKIIRY